jgi:nucleotidyltransferase substrate binding protein (TIGR01987 family)
MTADKLVLTPFRKALSSLDKVLALEKDEVVRDAAIQRFEYTYELAWKMIKRHLEWSGDAEAGTLTRRDLFREAARIGLIADADVWFEYHQARNETSHTYEETAAEEVYESARKFAVDARALLNELEKHHS